MKRQKKREGIGTQSTRGRREDKEQVHLSYVKKYSIFIVIKDLFNVHFFFFCTRSSGAFVGWRLPGNHLFFLVGGMTSTAQNFSRSGKEVEAVVFKVLVYQWQQDLKVEKHAKKQHLN